MSGFDPGCVKTKRDEYLENFSFQNTPEIECGRGFNSNFLKYSRSDAF